jgi:hypothetical protein
MDVLLLLLLFGTLKKLLGFYYGYFIFVVYTRGPYALCKVNYFEVEQIVIAKFFQISTLIS